MHMKPFLANQNDVIKNFAVVMSVVVKRADCIIPRPIAENISR